MIPVRNKCIILCKALLHCVIHNYIKVIILTNKIKNGTSLICKFMLTITDSFIDKSDLLQH